MEPQMNADKGAQSHASGGRVHVCSTGHTCRSREPPAGFRHDKRRLKVLFVNNKDSFVWNLVDYVSVFEPDTKVVPNTISLKEVEEINPDAIVISPGPGHPGNARDIGNCIEIIKTAKVPVLGVCLGHQAITVAFGGEVSHSPSGPIHGKTAKILHDGTGIYESVPSPLVGGRYHSLAVEKLPDVLEVTAKTEDGVIMGIRHRKKPIFGLQFHPESVLTPEGLRIVENFLRMARGK